MQNLAEGAEDLRLLAIDINNHEPICLVERKNRVVLEA
jgi:hypothetical protein